MILNDLVEKFSVQFFFFCVYPLGSGSRSIWTFLGSRIRIRIKTYADPKHCCKVWTFYLTIEGCGPFPVFNSLHSSPRESISPGFFNFAVRQYMSFQLQYRSFTFIFFLLASQEQNVKPRN